MKDLPADVTGEERSVLARIKRLEAGGSASKEAEDEPRYQLEARSRRRDHVGYARGFATLGAGCGPDEITTVCDEERRDYTSMPSASGF